QADATYCGIEFLEAARGADESAAGAESGNEMRDAAAGLLPDFVRGAAIVGLPVGRIAVLVGIEIFVGISGDHFFDFSDSAIGAFVAGSDGEFGAKCAENFFAFMRCAIG